MEGDGGPDHRNRTPDYLRPPSPEKAPPGPAALTDASPAAPEPEGEVSAMPVVGEPAVSRDQQWPRPPTRPRSYAPGRGRRESRPCNGVVEERGGRSSSSPPGLPAPSLAGKKRPPGRRGGERNGPSPASPEPEEVSSMLGGDPAPRSLSPELRPAWRISRCCPVPGLLGPNAVALDMSEASLLRSPEARSIQSTMEVPVRSCCSPFAGAVGDTRTESRP